MPTAPPRIRPQYQPPPARLRAWVRLLRPRHWIKNLVVFAGLLFKPLYTPDALLTTVTVFCAFCAVSSAGYIINDLLDAETDRAHPGKCARPVAAGRIRPLSALAVAFLLLVAALGAVLLLDYRVALVLLGYLAVTTGYSLVIKHHVILDIFAIGAGFLLRAWGGALAISVVLSPWLLVCLLLLALLLGFGKRRHELTVLGDDPDAHRPVLAHYTPAFIDQAMTATLAAALVSYALYAINSPTATAHPDLVYTVPIVAYAMLRYLYLVMHAAQGGKPEEIFLTDLPMITAIALWGISVIVIFSR